MEYGYFDSEITGYEDTTGMPIFDRAQNAQFLADMYASLITSGVYPNPSDNYQVMERDDGKLGVKVMPGRLWIKGRFGTDDEPTVLDAPTASTTANRIDIVVAELNFVDRKIELKYVTGGATAPSLVRNTDAYQIQLAQVTVPKNTTKISQGNILDTRANTALCGYVTGIITQVDTTTLFNQYAAKVRDTDNYIDAYITELNAAGTSLIDEIENDYASDMSDFKLNQQNAFNEWFESIQNVLGEDEAGNLLNLILANTDRIELLEYMVYFNDYLSPIDIEDGILITDDGNAIMANWKYKEA